MEMGRNAGGGKPFKRHLAGGVIGVVVGLFVAIATDKLFRVSLARYNCSQV